jgi:predicted  nucleic acid-binding Zn-ribbon protein
MLSAELEKLEKIQALDLEIFQLKERLEKLPRELEAFKKNEDVHRKALEELKQTNIHLKVERRQKETDLKAIEEQIKNLQSKLNDVKTNKEYLALKDEIEILKKKSSAIEDEILVHMENDEIMKEREKTLAAQVEEEKVKIAEKEVEVEKLTAQLKEQIAEKEKIRTELAGGIKSEILALYEKVVARQSDGVGLAKLQTDGGTNICTGCYVRTPGYIAEKVRKKKDIIQCENCGRILY